MVDEAVSQQVGMRRRSAKLSLKRGLSRARIASLGPTMPRCCTCGRPLTRVPAGLVSSMANRTFQCEDCFYPGTGHQPARSCLVSSERTRWWSELAGEEVTSGK